MATLGIIAGSGRLAELVASAALSQGRDVFLLALEGQADPAFIAASKLPHAWVRLGAAGQGFDALRNAKASDVVMAGGVRRPSLKELAPDWRAAKFFARIGLGALGDDGLLKVVIKEFEAEGFNVLGPDDILQSLLAREGAYGRHAPDEQALTDIALGVRVAKALGALDVGQAVVVQQGLVLGLEAIEGTAALIARCKELRRDGEGGVLVKTAKPQQERRVDLPSIGPDTVAQAHAAGLRGIAVETSRSLVLDESALIESADRLGLFVVGVTA
ncbi:MAG: UDP-2,3-diacylglucosamine diphosphatase LpxI [Alphaproteobacteria bacterium]|nr:UDP-2,3-diacylglucosamine diphosphatase LpxI [Alphaproteobacteria bacterium]